MGVITLSTQFGTTPITLETGRVAKLASGAVLVTMGETVVLVTCVGARSSRPGQNFLPLTCDYIEKMYAAGRIPGGYFKREGRQGPWEILVSRLMDRPLRPLFPGYWRSDIQIIATVLSADNVNDPSVCAMVGASAAATLSDVPFDGPIGGCRVALIDGEYVVNPTYEQRKRSKIDLIVAGSRQAIVMVEGEAREVSETQMIDAIMAAHEAIKPVIALQEEMQRKAGRPKMKAEAPQTDADLFRRVIDLSLDRLADAVAIPQKEARYDAVAKVSKDVVATLVAEEPELATRTEEIKDYLKDIQKDIVRTQIIEEGVRIDGRGPKDIRRITCEVGVLPRTHGSALFTRGETQSLTTVTLGTRKDEQRIDNLRGDKFVRYMLHYNFPPFSTGETKPLRGPGRREIGHGYLAQRGVEPTLPEFDDFSYTLRIVSEILESNGSSSMATVCASSLALMDAGVPVKKPVAGIAMGLIQDGDRIEILSDILGDEDHLGDMDFKVVGTKDGITALQMDIKVQGLSRQILERALEQAKEGRLYILRHMAKALKAPRKELSQYAPRILTYYVKPDKIRDVIGPGGKTIRGIIEQTGVAIDVDDTGRVSIASPDLRAAEAALEIIKGLTQEPEVGRIYRGTVRKIMDFGAFVEILPGTDGLVHISELADQRVARVEDVLSEGDEVMVKCIGVDRQGKIRLSRKEALAEAAH